MDVDTKNQSKYQALVVIENKTMTKIQARLKLIQNGISDI